MLVALKNALQSIRSAIARRCPTLRTIVRDHRRYGRSSLTLYRTCSKVLYVPVLGMYRSGTSCVASLLAANGLFLGDDLIPANEHNERGFFESDEAIQINEELLARFGANELFPPDFLSRFPRPLFSRAVRYLRILGARHQIVGWKDPRTTVTWPAWHEVLSKSRYQIVACFRHPLRVAASLQKIFTSLELQSAVQSWLNYNRRLLSMSDDLLWVNFDAPLTRQLSRVCSRLGLPFNPNTLASYDDNLVHNKASLQMTGNIAADDVYTCLLHSWEAQEGAAHGCDPRGPSLGLSFCHGRS